MMFLVSWNVKDVCSDYLSKLNNAEWLFLRLKSSDTKFQRI